MKCVNCGKSDSSLYKFTNNPTSESIVICDNCLHNCDECDKCGRLILDASKVRIDRNGACYCVDCQF